MAPVVFAGVVFGKLYKGSGCCGAISVGECCRGLDFFGAETLENVRLEEMEGSPRQIRADLARIGQAGTSLPRART